jgi:hypothetical protein
MSRACTIRKNIEMILANAIYPIKKLFGIHIVPTKKQNTKKNFVPQHPSWKIEAAVFLPRIMKKISRWKQANTKLILIIAEGPMHQLPSLLGMSSLFGH